MFFTKKIFLITFLFLISCKSNNTKKNSLTDLESLQSKSSFINLSKQEVDLNLFSNKKIILNYWATWCGPCIKEMPDLMIAEKKLKDSNVSLFLVSDEDVSVISKFVDNNPYTLNFLKSNVSNEMLGVYSLPTTILFDNKGNKVETIVGVLDFSDENLINKFLKY
ncbi:MAG: TlpA family protein disulfide reductase [Flavobacteriaceae bacterium]|nr:TlpA family protein disulfide reductase [Flavobacteriaceae bacterium]